MNGKSIFVDIAGLLMTSIAIVMNTIAGWFNHLHINQTVAILLSIFTLLFLIVRTWNAFMNGIYERREKRLRIKKLKKEIKDEK